MLGPNWPGGDDDADTKGSGARAFTPKGSWDRAFTPKGSGIVLWETTRGPKGSAPTRSRSGMCRGLMGSWVRGERFSKGSTRAVHGFGVPRPPKAAGPFVGGNATGLDATGSEAVFALNAEDRVAPKLANGSVEVRACAAGRPCSAFLRAKGSTPTAAARGGSKNPGSTGGWAGKEPTISCGVGCHGVAPKTCAEAGAAAAGVPAASPTVKTWLHLLQRIRMGLLVGSFSSETLNRVWQFSQ